MRTLGRRLPRPAVSRCLSSRSISNSRTPSIQLLSKKLRDLNKEINASEKLARTLRNKGSIDATLLRTLRAGSEHVNSSGNHSDCASSVSVTSHQQGRPPQETNDNAPPTKKRKKKTKPFVPPVSEKVSVYGLLDSVQKTMKTQEEAGWGPDRLQPTDQPLGATSTPLESESQLSSQEQSESGTRLKRPAYAPHLQPEPTLSYSRRIEGLLEPTNRPTLEDVQPLSEQYPIATLSHGLDRVLFNPGIHWLQDPRSKVYNFPPYLELIPKVTDFAFERLGGFIKSSRDNDLWDLARREKRTFAGSTSSLSGMLSHIYFLLSGDKDVNTDNLSRHFGKEPRSFTSGQRMPASILMNHKDGMYAIDSDSDKEQYADKNILTWMGTLLERFLTSTPEEFAPYMRFNPPPPQVENRLRDAYRYAKSEKFVMRSQLDCVDSRLPGTGVFDIKTRACLPIRMDLLNFKENSGYLIRSQTGKLESFEREYYDLIRSAFLKYSFQVRIGNMDGVIVAYHNTARLFGFQYISLQEMDEAVFGSGEGVGDRVFAKCVGLLEKVLEEAAACFPGESVKCMFEKLEGEGVMNVWVQQEKPQVEEGELPPIKQLEVRVSNFLGQNPVRGSTAVGSVGEPWTTHWSIAKLMSSGADVHAGLEAAKMRQFRYIDIPTGLDAETVGAMWSALNFGGVERPEGSEVWLPDHHFRAPGPRTQGLRDLARAGAKDTAKKVIEEEGRDKVWLGGTVEWAELQKVAELYGRKEEPVEVVEVEEQAEEVEEQTERRLTTDEQLEILRRAVEWYKEKEEKEREKEKKPVVVVEEVEQQAEEVEQQTGGEVAEVQQQGSEERVAEERTEPVAQEAEQQAREEVAEVGQQAGGKVAEVGQQASEERTAERTEPAAEAEQQEVTQEVADAAPNNNKNIIEQ